MVKLIDVMELIHKMSHGHQPVFALSYLLSRLSIFVDDTARNILIQPDVWVNA